MSFPFFDSHVHFWDQQNLPYPWLVEVPAIAGRHTPVELRVEAAPDLPEKIVFVECGAPPVEELFWVERLATVDPRIAAIVAKISIDRGDATLRAIDGLATHPLVRGVRHIFQDEADAFCCARPEFIAGVRALAPAGLSFDLCCRHHQLPAVLELVRACPDTRFILDHAGKPDIRAHRLDPWREHIAALAALPNIDCKLSGLITEADPLRWTIDDLRPYLAHLLATFGPPRLLFGSDWPVAKLAGAYPLWLETTRKLLSGLAAPEIAAIFLDNARRVYRLA